MNGIDFQLGLMDSFYQLFYARANINISLVLISSQIFIALHKICKFVQLLLWHISLCNIHKLVSVMSSAKKPRRWYGESASKMVSKTRNAFKLRDSVTLGTILILLSGRFRGSRVVYLK